MFDGWHKTKEKKPHVDQSVTYHHCCTSLATEQSGVHRG